MKRINALISDLKEEVEKTGRKVKKDKASILEAALSTIRDLNACKSDSRMRTSSDEGADDA